jgi:hypothetical protein
MHTRDCSLVLAVGSLLAACVSPRAGESVAGRYSLIPGVTSGMSVADLIAKRPGAKVAEFIGYKEAVAEDSAFYHVTSFDQRGDLERYGMAPGVPSKSAVVKVVELRRHVPTTDSGRRLFRHRVRELAFLGIVTCAKYRVAEYNYELAYVVSKNQTVGVRFYPAATDSAHYVFPAAVHEFEATELHAFVPSTMRLVPHECV